MTDDWRILDVGCGPAPICRLLRRGEKFGLDPLNSFFKATNIVEAQGVHLIQGRAEELPIKERTFDLIIFRNVLDHTENPIKTLKEAARVLRDGGIVLIAVYCYSSFITHLKRTVEKGPVSFLKEPYHLHYFTIYDFEKLCATYFKIMKNVSVHEGTNCLDYGKATENVKMNHKCFSARLLSFLNSLFFSLRGKEFERFESDLFIGFWYMAGFLNRVTNRWYVRECLAMAEKSDPR
jgi:ubiquinone/menaquinone biosynthesis C-methylase UbiE